MNNIEQIHLLTQEVDSMRERYLKLVDLHGQLQMQNSLLEERVLELVETYSNEKDHFEQALFDAKQQISGLQDTVKELQTDKQRYKDDCNLAVRLLHRHPNEFVSTTSGQFQEQLKSRSDIHTPIQRSILMTTFPPTLVAPPPVFASTTSNVQNVSSAVVNDSLRLAAETLFKSNSVHRSPSTQFKCSDCHRNIKRCDVSIQTSLDNHNSYQDTPSRLRLISLTASDDGHTGDGTWLSLDATPSSGTIQEYQMNNSRFGYNDLSARAMPRMHHV